MIAKTNLEWNERAIYFQYLNEVARYPLLSNAEERLLLRKAAEGNRGAMDRLVRANLRFVVNIANMYKGQGLSIGELINEGNLGLMEAARRFDADQVLAILRQTPVTVQDGAVAAATAHIETIVARTRVVNQQLAQAHQKLDQLTMQLVGASEAHEQHDAAILRSLPGIGRIVLATLLSVAWEPLRRRDYHALRNLCGVAPVTKRSGKTNIVMRRRACHPRLANAVYYWARIAVQRDRICRAKYLALRERGHGFARALRLVADRQLKVACAMLRDGTLFDRALAPEPLPID